MKWKRPPTEAAPDIPDEHGKARLLARLGARAVLAMTLVLDADKSALELLIGASPPSVGVPPTLVREYFHTSGVVGGCRFPALHSGISGISSGRALVGVGIRRCNRQNCDS